MAVSFHSPQRPFSLNMACYEFMAFRTFTLVFTLTFGVGISMAMHYRFTMSVFPDQEMRDISSAGRKKLFYYSQWFQLARIIKGDE